MTSGVLSRTAELRAITEFLASAASGPTGLVLEGEAGMGKTALWFDALEQARRCGFRVLSAQVGEAETVLAYSALADLLADLEPAVLAELPALQRLAVDRVLLKAESNAQVTDQRVAAAAFVAVVDALAAQSPVLIAIDDAQWLDPSSRTVIAYGVRRFHGHVGVLASERSEPDEGFTRQWLRLNQNDEPRRIRLKPLGIGVLHSVISAKLGRSLPRAAMTRIHELSGGNPFYALELARAMDGTSFQLEPGLPATLSDLVRMRIGRLDGDVRKALLAIACVAAPTIDLLARITDTPTQRVVDLLEGVETDGIIGIEGNRVRFSHPLLAHGVYTDAAPASRRAMHRALAAIESEPELKARHLALASSSADEATLAALDAAADSARSRGAPGAAAELLDLAIGLGGDKVVRRVRAAGDHFLAGSTDRAEDLLAPTVDALRPGMLRGIALNLLAAIRIYDNNFVTAVDLLTRAAEDASDVAPLLAQTLMNLSFSQGHGAFGEGFGDAAIFDEVMKNARKAVVVAETSGMPGLESQALSHWAMAQFIHGHGIDETSLARAMALEPFDVDIPLPFSASAVDGLIYACIGRLDEARDKMLAVRLRSVERGAERNMMAVEAYSALIELWSGNFAAASTFADEAVARAQQLGRGDVDIIALSIRAAVHAHAGRQDRALADAQVALKAAQGCDAPRMAEWPLMAKSFMEVTLGRHGDALATLEPLVSRFGMVPGTEIIAGWYLPNAAEAMVALERLDDAEPLISALEQNGAALDRPWMLAAGGRCRGMWLGAKGEIEGAIECVERAMTEHDRTPMRFERARTLLFLGKLQRRRRRKAAAQESLTEALTEFIEMGAPLWANQVRAELARTNVRAKDSTRLTPSERRVADLAATGMTNRDIASALFIQAKTVEHNLSRVYVKLGIRSRVELIRRLAELPDDD